MKFTDFNLHPDIQKGIDDAGFTECTPVQELTFTNVFNGSDILAQSQTGTGKTAAFLVSLFQLFINDKVKNKKALILVPTRELAVQIEQEASKIGKFLPFKVGSFFGGVGYGKQEMMLQEGVDFYIATPGRLIDYVKGGKINLSTFGAVVIDEADRMFDMGFIPDIKFLLKKTPPPSERITMLFSATLSPRVKSLASEYMNKPAEIEIAPESITLDAITQSLYHVSTHEKMPLLLGILKNINPVSAIIFANTKHKVEEVSMRLKHNGYENEFIIGDLPQKRRQKIIDGIKSGRIKFLVATDVAARGLHVDDLGIVINYDLPDDCENYIHRIGRTARAGKDGLAVSLACEKYVYNLEAIEKYTGKKIPVEWAEDGFMLPDKSADIRFMNENAKKAHHLQKNSRDHEKRSSSNKFSKSINRTHTSPDKPIINKRVVVTEPKKVPFKVPQHADAVITTKKKIKPKRDGSLEQRLEYYREKYGESFKVTDDFIQAEKNRMKREKKGLIKRIKNLFGF